MILTFRLERNTYFSKMQPIPISDLKIQYQYLKNEIDAAIQNCLETAQFVGGNAVTAFENNLADYIGIKHVIGCANGTDALQLALMALNLPKGSKIIVPAFTYIAPIEVIRFLGHEIVYADVDTETFNITLEEIKKVYTDDVRAIIVVHLYGQPCNINEIYAFAQHKNIYLIEDNAQSVGAEKNITRNSIITTSFFPSKNLGSYGDGGAVMTNNDTLAKDIRMIANHGQSTRYYYELVGINSRLDTIQASILDVKLKYLDNFIAARQKAADFYDEQLKDIQHIQIPTRIDKNQHTFYLYTLKIKNGFRNELQSFLKEKQITSVIHYPIASYLQNAYLDKTIHLKNTEDLCEQVLSIPIYPEITHEQLSYICDAIKLFFADQ